MIKIIFSFLFLFLHAVSAQTVSRNESSGYLFSEDDPSAPKHSSSLSTKTSSLNGKIELGGMLLIRGTAALILEFEQSILNSNLMWLLQAGGGGLISKEQTPRIRHCLRNCPQRSELNPTIIPYALIYTGFKYEFISGLTASLTMGTKTFEKTLWSTASIGWNIMNKAHIELSLTAIYIQPVMLALSIGIPLKKW